MRDVRDVTKKVRVAPRTKSSQCSQSGLSRGVTEKSGIPMQGVSHPSASILTGLWPIWSTYAQAQWLSHIWQEMPTDLSSQ
jgi:hypothetical protein